MRLKMVPLLLAALAVTACANSSEAEKDTSRAESATKSETEEFATESISKSETGENVTESTAESAKETTDVEITTEGETVPETSEKNIPEGEGEFYSENDPAHKVMIRIDEADTDHIKVTFENRSDSALEYGEYMSLFKKNDDGAWERIWPRSNDGTVIATRDVLYRLEPKETAEKTYNMILYHLNETGDGEYMLRIEGINFEADDEAVDYGVYIETHQKNLFDAEIAFRLK